MFTWLQEFVYYPVAEFFGIFAGIANIKPDVFFECLNSALAGDSISLFVNCPNVWLGIGDLEELAFHGFTIDFSIFSNGFMAIIATPLKYVGELLFAGVGQFPLFVSLPLAFAKILLIVAFIKFIKGTVSIFG